MDNSDKTTVPPLGPANKDVNGAIRPSIHGARSVPLSGNVSQGSRTNLPKLEQGGINRPPSIVGGRAGSPSQQISMRPKLGDNIPGARTPSVVFPRPASGTPSLPPMAPVSSASIPAAPPVAAPPTPSMASLPPLSRTPAPVEASSAMDATTRALLPEELEGFEEPVEEDEEINISTKALLPDELEACGLPPEFEGLEDEPEIELENLSSTLPVGMKIDDRYEIKGVLGVGGFATVYKAHHLTIDRDVALKVMDLKKGVDPSYSQRFFREAKIAAKIHHNNVVSIYDFGHVAETGQPYIAMEMLHGHDLSHELTEAGPLSPKRAFVLFRPVLEALGQGHRLGIVHKDLKPENLYLVDPRGQRELMKVLDFGVARINSSEVAKLTSAGQLLGTPRYLAPEYIKQQLVSPAIDVYQMALIISEALTGVPAVSGDPFHAMMLHCSGKLQIAEFLLEGRVGEVFRKAICIDPEMRFQDCDAFAAALDEIADCFTSTTPLKGGAPQLTPDSRTSSKLLATPFDSGHINTGESLQVLQEPPKRSMAPVIIVVLLILAIAGLAGYYFYTQMEAKNKALLEAQKKDEPPPDVTYTFQFKTVPSGASIKLKGGSNILCKSPCKHDFKSSGLPASIVVSLDGYHSSDLELTPLLYESENGKVTVELIKQVEQIKELEFTLKYTPENAVVTESASGKKVCLKSPCEYIFNIDKGYVALTFSAPGFKSKSMNLAKPLYDENKGLVNVSLDKDIPRPAAKKTAPVQEAPKSAPAPAPEPKSEPKPAPAPKPEKKPEIMLL